MLKGRTKSAYGGVGTRKCELRLIEENKQGTHRTQSFPVCKLILGISQMLPALGTEKPFPAGPEFIFSIVSSVLKRQGLFHACLNYVG